MAGEPREINAYNARGRLLSMDISTMCPARLVHSLQHPQQHLFLESQSSPLTVYSQVNNVHVTLAIRRITKLIIGVCKIHN